MNYIYYVEIKHTPKYKNGAYRKSYVPFTARSPENALRQAAQYCVDKGISAVGFDATWEGIPASNKARFRWIQERRLAKEQAKLEQTQRLIDYNSDDAFADSV